MDYSVVRTDDAPAPVGPYSQAVVAGDTVYCSGQLAIDPSTGALVTGDIAIALRLRVDLVLEPGQPKHRISTVTISPTMVGD